MYIGTIVYSSLSKHMHDTFDNIKALQNKSSANTDSLKLLLNGNNPHQCCVSMSMLFQIQVILIVGEISYNDL